MNKSYTVFSAQRHYASVPATLEDGTHVTATVDSLELQLLPPDNSGTLKFVFTKPDEIAQAEAQFVEGASVVITLALGA